MSIAHKGNVIHALSIDNLEFICPGAVIVNGEGIVERVVDLNKEELPEGIEVVDHGEKMIIPGLVDCHLHAPQYYFSGTGMGLQLLEWLETHTFPVESKYKDTDFAKQVYDAIVKRTLKNGTTTASYFGTIHLEGSKALADICEKRGQRGFVGKVNMDRNSPDFYIEETQKSLEDTEEFVKYCIAKESKFVIPVITPRFVPTCTSELMTGLGEIAEKYDIPIQSHLDENKGEIAWVASLHPECKSYTDVYAQHKLLNNKTYMAHCIHLNDEEKALMKEREAALIHCPNSNFTLSSGILDVRQSLNLGLTVGMGTDVAGGYSPSMLECIRSTLVGTQAKTFQKRDLSAEGTEPEDEKPLSYKEVFYLATVGGARALAMDNVGNFMPGKQFDALVVDVNATNSPIDMFPGQSVDDCFQKFIFIGDDRCIERVYVSGQQADLN
eukprot:TRINITY_DN3567_c0_g2_i1.p1 TRINITY_DN3567_c0_g2~~TRINITY_DN3567_c0_g2_i1.p1  ORF type:complete len:440 (+),score=171.04 TRINITY_DN3567_c0_g2_i1:51-1370(+)